MGWWDSGRSYSTSDVGGGYARTTHSHSHRRDSPPRTRSPSGGGGGGYFVRPAATGRSTSSSFFGGGGSTRGIFSSGGGGGGSSYYRRRPRDGYVAYLLHKLQRMIRELWQYARRHPVKAFFAVVVPLLSAGGAIHGLMRQFGLRVPGLEGMAAKGGGGYYGSRGYEGGGLGGLGGLAGGGQGGLMGNAGSLMQIAKAFM